ncbi:hypothetical protein SLS63_003881 [Diaporthe eres]|uniref:Uncharacterized protein n=1 Tax=Diaporthe eres TaxID=83184 RepID=A0ABR1PF88_DIAER
MAAGPLPSLVFENDQLEEPLDRQFAPFAERTVPHLSVEFLRTGGPKPHVVFNLKLNPPRGQLDPDYKAARVSMEWDGGHSNNSDYRVTLLPYIGSSFKATAAFDFPVLNKTLKLKEWLKILEGRSTLCTDQHQTNLSNFDFRYARENPGAVDGCRDWVFENFAMIPRHPELNSGNKYWFFDIIDKNFVKVHPTDPNSRIRISVLVMNRGRFMDRRNPYTQIEVFTVLNLPNRPQYRINYNSETPPPSRGPGGPDGPGGSGGPGGPGGPGGKPPGGRPSGGKPPGSQPPSSTGGGRGPGTTGPTGGAPSGNQLGHGGPTAPLTSRPKVNPTAAAAAPVGDAKKKAAPADAKKKADAEAKKKADAEAKKKADDAEAKKKADDAEAKKKAEAEAKKKAAALPAAKKTTIAAPPVVKKKAVKA